MMTNTAATTLPDRPRSWISSATAVHEHLFFAASTIGTVEVRLMLSRLPAVLAFPQAAHGTVDLLLPKPPRATPDAGTLVQLSYRHENHSYEFDAPLESAVEPGRWRLQQPTAIACRASRGAQRIPLVGVPGFRLRLEHSKGAPLYHPLHDLSLSGVAYRHSGASPHAGTQLPATLELPRTLPIPVCLDVRHTRLDGPIRITGCLLQGISPWGAELLARSLARQR